MIKSALGPAASMPPEPEPCRTLYCVHSCELSCCGETCRYPESDRDTGIEAWETREQAERCLESMRERGSAPADAGVRSLPIAAEALVPRPETFDG